MTRRVKSVTAGLVLLATGLAGCTGSAGSPPDASPTPTRTTAKPTPVKVAGTVNTSKKVKLSLRKQPTIESDRLARIPHKTKITMTCKTIGTTVSNGTRASNVWTKVTYKKKTGYVSSVFVKGGDSAKLSVCQTATVKPSATPTRPPNVEPAIIKAARSQKGVTEKKGKKKNCTPYGGCMPWSSLFATWAWNKAGDSVPRFSFSGDLYNWESCTTEHTTASRVSARAISCCTARARRTPPPRPTSTSSSRCCPTTSCG